MRGFHQEFKHEAISFRFVSRCLEPMMKPEVRVFDMASQNIFCCIVVIYYCIVLLTKLLCKLFKVGLVVTFFGSHFRMCL